MGGFLAGGDKNWRDAQVFSYAADIEAKTAKEREQRRYFLQDIREARIAQAYQDWYASSTDEYVTASGTSGAIGNIFSNFSGAYRYSIDQSNSLKTIQNLNMLSEKLQKRAEHMDKRAVNNAKMVTGALQTAGAAIGAAVGGPAGAMVGSQIGGAMSQITVSALHGGKAARKYAQHATGESIYGLATGGMSSYLKSSFSEEPVEDMSEYNLTQYKPDTEEFAKQAGLKPKAPSQNDYINKLTAAQSSSSMSGGFFNMISSFSSSFGG